MHKIIVMVFLCSSVFNCKADFVDPEFDVHSGIKNELAYWRILETTPGLITMKYPDKGFGKSRAVTLTRTKEDISAFGGLVKKGTSQILGVGRPDREYCFSAKYRADNEFPVMFISYGLNDKTMFGYSITIPNEKIREDLGLPSLIFDKVLSTWTSKVATIADKKWHVMPEVCYKPPIDARSLRVFIKIDKPGILTIDYQKFKRLH